MFTAVVIVGGYAVIVANAPLPAAAVEATIELEQTISADQSPAQAVAHARSLPTAVGWLDDGAVFANDDSAYPIASISKLVTILVALEAQPLEPGSDGATYTWTDDDDALQQYYVSLDGIAFPIPAGTEVTTRQMLTLALLPSANDFAAAYARSVFGDDETFLTAVADWQHTHGIESLAFVEPTGMDEANVASAADVVRIGRLALANPTITEFTSLQSAELPWGIGVIENTNPLLGELPGVIGLKTGRSSVAGFNLVAAQQTSFGGRELVKISATLGRNSGEERAAAARETLAELEPLPATTSIVDEGELVGTVTTAWGDETSLVSSGSATAVLTPGESAARTLTLSQVGAGAAGQPAGVIRVEAPAGVSEAEVVTAGEITEPGFWWRFAHPFALMP